MRGALRQKFEMPPRKRATGRGDALPDGHGKKKAKVPQRQSAAEEEEEEEEEDFDDDPEEEQHEEEVRGTPHTFPRTHVRSPPASISRPCSLLDGDPRCR